MIKLYKIFHFLFILIVFLYPKSITPQKQLNEVSSWAYQLQNANNTEISENSTFELIVIDYSADGSEELKYSREEISQIKNSGKIVLAYISIGEAENYRFYWQNNWDANKDGKPDTNAPSWLGDENKNWEGNYKVRFWEPEWQNIIFAWIDTIIAQGFDGIYCDIIDAYYYWQTEIGSEPLADKYMIEFVSNIRSHILAKTSQQFYIFPQNGEYIIEEENITEELKQKYFDAIDAIGIEDVFFVGDLDENNSYNPDNERIGILNQFKNNGKKIFSIEYLNETTLIEKYLQEAEVNKYIPYTNNRALDKLNNGIISSIAQNDIKNENSFSLDQNYPNPFNPETKISYSIPFSEKSTLTNVVLKIYSADGKEIQTIINERKAAGEYNITLNFGAKNKFASGVYFYKISARNYTKTKKMVYLK